jgi:hypothetical protein
VAFCRWGVEHAFCLAKGEIGFGHYEGRSWKGLLRHMILCRAVMLFVAEQTDRPRAEKPGADDGADGPRPQSRLRTVAAAPPQVIGYRALLQHRTDLPQAKLFAGLGPPGLDPWPRPATTGPDSLRAENSRDLSKQQLIILRSAWIEFAGEICELDRLLFFNRQVVSKFLYRRTEQCPARRR